MMVASQGSVCATAFSFGQTHGIMRIMTTAGAGTPAMSIMK